MFCGIIDSFLVFVYWQHTIFIQINTEFVQTFTWYIGMLPIQVMYYLAGGQVEKWQVTANLGVPCRMLCEDRFRHSWISLFRQSGAMSWLSWVALACVTFGINEYRKMKYFSWSKYWMYQYLKCAWYNQIGGWCEHNN